MNKHDSQQSCSNKSLRWALETLESALKKYVSNILRYKHSGLNYTVKVTCCLLSYSRYKNVFLSLKSLCGLVKSGHNNTHTHTLLFFSITTIPPVSLKKCLPAKKHVWYSYRGHWHQSQLTWNSPKLSLVQFPCWRPLMWSTSTLLYVFFC